MSEDLIDAITRMSKEDALSITQELLNKNVDPDEILDIGRTALHIVGDRFEAGEFFLPELIVSGDIFSAIVEVVKPHLGVKTPQESLGKVVIGTVEGDIHDIGKNTVVFMLENEGFEVIDLGVDVTAEKFVSAVQDHRAQIVGLSGLLTIAIPSMKETVFALRQSDIKNIKIMIGGAPINNQVCDYTGADAYGKSAVEGVLLAKRWVGLS